MKSVKSFVLLASAVFVASAVAHELVITKKILDGSRPAVSRVNGKLEVGAGAVQGDGLGFAAGSISMPLGKSLGVQLDAQAGNWGGNFVGGFATHSFWRNPDYALAGFYGSFTYSDQHFGPAGNSGIHIGRLGAEFEVYIGKVSFETVIGVEAGDIRTRIFGITDLAFYPVEDVRLAAGHRYIGGKHMGALGAEYLLPFNIYGARPAVFAEARAGQDDYRAVVGGVRVYFGDEKKSLMARHRQDDPRSRLTDEMFAVSSAQMAKNSKFKPVQTIVHTED